MPRRPRQEGPGAVHHVVIRSATDAVIVADALDCTQLLDELRGVVHVCGWECIAFCVMTTHAHFVVHTPEPSLGRGMRLLQGRYATAFNRRHARQGHLFGRRYWSRRILRPHYLRCAALYTVLNAPAAGLCAHPRDYAWCSYRETAGIGPGFGIVRPALLLSSLDESPDVARRLYRELVDDAVERLARRRADDAWWQAVDGAVAARTTG
jgi:putative transposase